MIARVTLLGESRQTCTGEEMGMNRSGTSVMVVLSLALAGCSSGVRELKEVTAPTLCKVTDSDGRFYEATDLAPLNALENAVSQCTLAARDPTTCQEVACAPMQ
jgi:hypothetical protein